MMLRREFITLLGGAAALPVEARAQERLPTPTIGWLDPIDPNSRSIEVATFKQGLAAQGYVVGRNVNLEFRSGGADAERMRVLAADLVRRQVAAIVTIAGAVNAAKAATQSIPIVFIVGVDPVGQDLVTSLNRPGGNLTGVAALSTEIAAKRLELLHELVPKAESIAAVVLPSEGPAGSDFARAEARGVQSAADALGVRLLLLPVTDVTESDIAGAVANAVRQRAGALLIGAQRIFNRAEAQTIALANRYSLPNMFARSSAVAAGGLASYGADLLDEYRQLGVYTGRILKGEKPADLPIVQPTKFELAINLKTAKALGVTVPPTLLVAADEVIE
jgi:putative tryptophan/tyrosine transport system substrate-binding protein